MSTWFHWVRVFGISITGSLFLAMAASADTFIVDSTLDQVDDDTSDGVCHTATGTCTLRAAVMQANLILGAEARIVLPAGTYSLTIPGSGADGDDSGDLNFTTPASGHPVLLIDGAGRSSTVIDANLHSRILRVHLGRTASLSDLTLRNGNVSLEDGGGISNRGELFLTRCMVSGNAGGRGGGIANFRDLYLNDCTISGNTSELQGGGIYSDFFAYLERTEILSNVASSDGGGIAYRGTLHTTASTIAQNTAHVDGGGIYSSESMGEDLTLINTTIYLNDADRNGGGIYFGSLSPFNANVFSSTIAFNGADADADQGGGNGGGIYVAAGSGFHLRNTLVVGNTLFNQPIYEECWGTLNSYGRNLFWEPGGACAIVTQTGSFGVLNGLDGLGPLQKNGGSTRTVALLPGSNAIDGGDPDLGCIGPDLFPFATDQRSAARVFGVRCDLGAYEAGTLFFDGFESGDLSAW